MMKAISFQSCNDLSGGSGYAKRITFEEITLIQVHNPIIMTKTTLHFEFGIIRMEQSTCVR
ncbi:hypothetical protein CR513_18913, partial [Mucuna pruriens]